MNFELSLILILCVVTIYMVVIKVFSVLFQITGLPKNISKYQSISLFTNCGFTTSESETITKNKARRRISLACMITGSFFSVIIVSLIVNMISSFTLEQGKNTYLFIIIVCCSFILLLLFFQIKIIKKFVSGLFDKIVSFFIKKKNKENILTIVEHFGNNSIVEIYLHIIPDILINKTIHESKLKNQFNINILSIKRNKKMIEITRNTYVNKDDILLVYGPVNNVEVVFNNEKISKDSVSQENQKFNIVDLIDNYGDKAMVEVKINNVPVILENRTLMDSGLKDKFGINIMFIKRNEEVVEVDKDTIVMKDDTLVIFGPYQAIRNVFIL